MPKKIKSIFSVLLIIILVICTIDVFGMKEFLLKKVYPEKYSEFVVKYAEEYGVDPLLVYAVIKAESNFNNNLVSSKNAKGVMQLMDGTAREIACNGIINKEFEADMLFDVETNIKLGTKYLSNLIDKYGNYYVAVAAYNARDGNC